jgi:hypothetical protein
MLSDWGRHVLSTQEASLHDLVDSEPSAVSSGEEALIKVCLKQKLDAKAQRRRGLTTTGRAQLKAQKLAQYAKAVGGSVPSPAPLVIQDPLSCMNSLTRLPARDLGMLRAMVDVKNVENRGYLEMVWCHFPKFRTRHNLLLSAERTKILQETDSIVVMLHRKVSQGRTKLLGVRVFEKPSEMFPHRLQYVVATLVD